MISKSSSFSSYLAARRRTAPLQRLRAAALGAAALSLLGLSAAHAQTTYTDTGTSTSMAAGFTAGGFAIPANGTLLTDTLTFNNTGTQTDDLTAAQVLNAMSLNFASMSALTLNGGTSNTINLAGGATITLSNTALVTNNLNVTLAGPTAVSGGGSAIFGNLISGAGGLTLGTAGTSGAAGTGYTGSLTLLNANTFKGGTIVNSGMLTLNDGGGNNGGSGTGGGSNVGAVQGMITVNTGGTLTLAATNALGYNSDGTQVTLININGGLVNTLSGAGNEGYHTSFSLTGGTLADAAASSANNSYQFAAGDPSAPGITSNASAITSLISGGLNIRNGNLGFTVAKGTTASGVDLDVTGAITNGSNGSGIVKNGAGNLKLDNNASNFNGNIVINAGMLTTGAGQYNTTTGSTELGSDAAAGRTITVNNSGILSFTSNNVFGGGYSYLPNVPTLIINSGGLVTSNNYNAIAAVTLNGGTLTQNAGSGSASYQGYQFIGNFTVGGTTASTISNNYNGTTTNAGDHLGTNTQFNVAATGAAGPDLIVSAPLRNSSGDYNGGAAGALTKLGAGTMALTATSVYSGGTTITGGTLALSAAKADGTGALSVGTGTTIQTGVSGALGGGAVTLTAGTIQNTDLTANDPTPTVSHPGVSSDKQGNNAAAATDTLTLGNGASILDFGAGNTGAIFDFADSSLATWTGTLSVYDYSGLYPAGYNAATNMYTTGGGGLDQLFFGNGSGTGLTAAQLGDITFYSDNGKTLYPGGSAVILSDGEVVAAPEPSAWAGLGLTALGLGGLLLRARKRRMSEALLV